MVLVEIEGVVAAAVTLLFVLEKIVFGSQAHRRIVRFEELTEGA